MPEKLCLLVCENFALEFEHLAASEQYSGVPFRVATFPAGHTCHLLRWSDIRPALEGGEERCERIHVIGGECAAGMVSSSSLPKNCTVHSYENCHDLIANRELLEAKLDEGAYLVTPGWLARWRDRLDEWGFDRKTAGLFFGESMKKVLLLETAVDPGSIENLLEFAEYVELPHEVLPVGVSHLRLLVSNLAMDCSMQESEKKASVALADADRRAADYEMVFDIVSDLAAIDAEEKAVEKVFDLFEMLFAPAGMRYVSIEAGKSGKVYCRSIEGKLPRALEIWSLGLEAGLRHDEGGRGFTIDIAYQGETLGVIDVSEVAFPQHIARYVGVAEVLAAVCGLAIANARTFNELEVTNLELKGFAHTVSHDLKGPLSAVTMGVEQISAILEEALTEESVSDIAELAELVRRSAGKSTALVDEVLALAEAGIEPRSVSSVDVNETIDGILLERAIAIRQRGMTLEVSADLGQVSANPTHVYQVFSNLIGNAIKHNDSDSPEIRVDRLADTEDGGRRFLVRDNGSGIPPEDLEQIFVPFFKGAKTGETGIGLSTVARIVGVYNGSIVAYNDDGACFEFVLYDYR